MPMLIVLALTTLATLGLAADPPIFSDKPYAVTFPPQEARFVRVVVFATSRGPQPCIDELEVYGPDGEHNLALAKDGAKASASSLLPGYVQHRIEHLNDGQYGNAYSWIPATGGEEWAQIELPVSMPVARVILSRDRLGQYGDRIPTKFDVRLSQDGVTWQTVRSIAAQAISGAVGSLAAPPLPPPPPAPRLAPDGSLLQQPTADVAVPRQDELGFPNLALIPTAKAAASSVLDNGSWPIHQIAHLNDGLAGNARSWISNGEPSWAELDLGDVYWVYKLAFGSDSSRRYLDRAATTFSILAATHYDPDSAAPTWHQAFRQENGPPVHVRTEIKFRPVQARWIRILIEAGIPEQCRVDEIEVYGQRDEIPLDKIGPLAQQHPSGPDMADLLRDAFIGEEHAWLKTFGRADLDPALVPYNGRVNEYPRHVGDDRLPLPPVGSSPVLDGDLGDACWQQASRGVVRVADPYDFSQGPLVTYELWAARGPDDLFLAIRTNRLLSAHLAVLSSATWEGCGILVLAPDGLVFNTYTLQPDGQLKLDKSTPVASARNADLTCFELRLPLSLFPDCQQAGLRVGLGLGGRHTPSAGRPVNLVFSPLAIAEEPPCLNHQFRLRLSVPPGAQGVQVTGDVPELAQGLTLTPGEKRVLNLRAERGPIGPQLNLRITDDSGQAYTLHLFRYDPLERTLTLMEELADRLAAKGLDVTAERQELARLRARQDELLSSPPDPAAEREAFLAARLAKRQLFFREPDLEAAQRILFVKRHPYHPSHIYTDYTDAPFRPGGGVCILDIPRREGRLDPAAATLTTLFPAHGGIARDPVATFDLSAIYFAYRPSADGFYHLMRMNPDGSGLTQLTDGPYHDFYPCPLPDGGLAFITTRCAARVFCFRWGSSVLYRMDPDGSNMRPLSHSSLSEWAPSVMDDGRIIWTRWEYNDKGADFTQTLWSIRPDGSDPELVFGNTIIQPNGYACGRQVPGTAEICCTLVSHFGDINGPIALLDVGKGRMNPQAISSLTPEVPWPGMWPMTECFRDPLPLARDYFLCSHAPRDCFGLFIIDRFGNRELLYLDPTISSMAPTLFQLQTPPPVVPSALRREDADAHLVLTDVYRGLEGVVPRGAIKYLRVVEEVRHSIADSPNRDHADFMKWYATPVDVVSGPFGWPAYIAKAALGIVPVESDGSASFRVPAGKNLYFQVLDQDFNELQRMRSLVHLQPGETRTCVGCHEPRNTAPPLQRPAALRHPPRPLQPPSWGAVPFSFERVVQPVLDAKCVRCHDATHPRKLDFSATLDADRVPASYRTLISQGLVHVVDCGWNSGGCEKRAPMTFGTLQSKLWRVLNAGHHDVHLTQDEMLRIKTWTDLNCPLWPDYIDRSQRPLGLKQATAAP